MDDSIGDFDKNKGSFRLDFIGYTDTETPNVSRTIISPADATYFIPYWRKSISIEPKNDYIEDGDKDFEFRFYDTENNRDKIVDDGELTGAAGAESRLPFTVVDNSVPIYQFNTLYGYGTSDSSGINATGGTATLTEGNIHSFRIETTNVAGTLLWYSLSGTNITDNDFDDPFVGGRRDGQHPGPPSGYRGIRDSRYYYVYGCLLYTSPSPRD